MFDYKTLDISKLADITKDFTGVVITGTPNGSIILRMYCRGINFAHHCIDPKEDSIAQSIPGFNLGEPEDEFTVPDILVDSNVIETFEENLSKFPFDEDINAFGKFECNWED